MKTAETSNGEIALTQPYSVKRGVTVYRAGRFEEYEDTMIGILNSGNSRILVFNQYQCTQIAYIDGFFCMPTSELDYVSIWESKIHSDTEKLRSKTKFQRLVNEWEREHPRGVDVSVMVMHPSYQQIIGMGTDAIPLLLQELEHKPSHWFWALYAITGANPVPVESEGNLKKMTEAWITWGKEQGYRW